MQSELAKALSMAAPLSMLFYVFKWPIKNTQFLAFYAGMLLVIFPSFGYHFLCHLNHFPCTIDNDARRFDQSNLHLASALIAFALSGSITYFAFVFVYALIAVGLLWQRGEHDVPNLRRANIAVTLGLALLPMVWRKDYLNFVGAAASLLVITALFAYGGGGHTLSHLLLPFYIYFLNRSIRDF